LLQQRICDHQRIQKIIKQKIIINNLKKIKADQKTAEYKISYANELEEKSYN